MPFFRAVIRITECITIMWRRAHVCIVSSNGKSWQLCTHFCVLNVKVHVRCKYTYLNEGTVYFWIAQCTRIHANARCLQPFHCCDFAPCKLLNPPNVITCRLYTRWSCLIILTFFMFSATISSLLRSSPKHLNERMQNWVVLGALHVHVTNICAVACTQETV